MATDPAMPRFQGPDNDPSWRGDDELCGRCGADRGPDQPGPSGIPEGEMCGPCRTDLRRARTELGVL